MGVEGLGRVFVFICYFAGDFVFFGFVRNCDERVVVGRWKGRYEFFFFF